MIAIACETMRLMHAVYLSSQAPRWQLSSEADLHAALDRGLVTESHYLDAKRQLPTTSGGNRELARDLASFAIDGGTLIVGLAEDKTAGTFVLAAQPLAGAEEHVEQVARDIPDPPMAVMTRRVPTASDPERGYLLVHVPPSPVGPHMVDHRYLGRGDKTRHYLPDPEVRRLHERRRSAESDGFALLRAEFDRDPVPAGRREQAHLFLLAEPALPQPQPQMLLQLTSGQRWNWQVSEFLARATSREATQAMAGVGGFRPDLDDASNGARRPSGAARASHRLRPDRTISDDTDEEELVELEVHEDGGLRIFMGRFSDRMEDGERVLFDSAAVLYVRRLLVLVRAAAEQSGYFGNWTLAVGGTGLGGCRSFLLRQRWTSGPADPRYTDDTYQQVTATTYPELVNDPARVTERLLGRLLRALGTSHQHRAAAPDAPDS